MKAKEIEIVSVGVCGAGGELEQGENSPKGLRAVRLRTSASPGPRAFAVTRHSPDANAPPDLQEEQYPDK